MCNLPHGFDIYLVNVKTMRKIVQIFVAFSEKLNFTRIQILNGLRQLRLLENPKNVEILVNSKYICTNRSCLQVL